jgi:tetratricopeptide (TPR) repeat protein
MPAAPHTVRQTGNNKERIHRQTAMMKKACATLVLFFLFSQTSFGYWIWTPESKKWTNPKYAPKESPQEQLKFALGYFEIKDYETAYNELKKLVKYYPDALEAPEAQFYMGRCLEETGKFYEAFQAYQKVIDKYPLRRGPTMSSSRNTLSPRGSWTTVRTSQGSISPEKMRPWRYSKRSLRTPLTANTPPPASIRSA